MSNSLPLDMSPVPTRRRPLWRLLVWLALPLLLWLGLRTVPIREVWEILSGLDLLQLLALLLLNAWIFLSFSSRWWLILNGLGYRLPLFALVGYRLAAFGVTYFTPGPQMGGEPLQVYLSRVRHSLPSGTAIAAVTLDKLLELQANFAFLILGLAVILRKGLVADGLRLPALFLVIVLLLLPSAYLLALRLGSSPFTWCARRLLLRFHRRSAFRKLYLGSLSAETQVTGFLRHKPQALFQALLLSLFVWVMVLAEYWLALRFLGLQADLLQTIILLTAARVAYLLPVTAGVGTLEASQILAAQALGISPAYGIGISLLIRARDVAFAGFGLWLGAILARSPARALLNSAIGEPEMKGVDVSLK